jgi:hypothetical protein
VLAPIDAGPMFGPPRSPAGRWFRWLWRAVTVVVGLFLLVVLLGMCGIGLQGEPDTPSGFHVINHTYTPLDVFQVLPDGTEVPKLQVQPGEERDSESPCGGEPYVARTPSGELVASRGPFEECNQDPWVIGSDSG